MQETGNDRRQNSTAFLKENHHKTSVITSPNIERQQAYRHESGFCNLADPLSHLL